MRRLHPDVLKKKPLLWNTLALAGSCLERIPGLLFLDTSFVALHPIILVLERGAGVFTQSEAKFI